MARLHGRALRGDGPAGAVAAGRGRPRERARDVGRRGRRQVAHVQRAHGHVVLGPRAVAARRPRLPAGGVRAGRAALRPRHLEHEGRARVLRRGGARAAGRGRAAARRRAHRGGRAARSRRRSTATRRAASSAATRPARAISSRTAASRTCASSASRPRARSCSATSARSGCGSASRATSSTRRSARASAARTRSSARTRCSTRCSSGSRRWEDDPANAYRGAKAIVNVGAIEGGFGWRVSRTPHHTDLFLDVRVPPTKEMAVARGEVLEMVRGLAERFPDYGDRGRGLRHRARAPRSRRATSSSRRSTRRTRRSGASRRAAT